MKVQVYTPKGKVMLDLTVAKDIETFGGQDAVDFYMRNQKINDEIRKMAEERLIAKEES